MKLGKAGKDAPKGTKDVARAKVPAKKLFSCKELL